MRGTQWENCTSKFPENNLSKARGRKERKGWEERRVQTEGNGASSGQGPTGPFHMLPASAGQPRQGLGTGAEALGGKQGAPLKQSLPSARVLLV